MDREMETKQLFKGALLLSLAGLISKILSAGYRIPLQNIAGDLGFYIYQQIYPVLGMALMLSLYGFPAAISKLAVEMKPTRQNLPFASFYLPVFFVLFIGGAAAFLMIYMNADLIAGWMGDNRLANPLRTASFLFLLLPFPSILRGVLQSQGNVTPTAASQVIEQIIRTSIILFAAVYLVNQGQNFYNIGSGAALAAIVALTASSAYLMVTWIKTMPLGKQQIPVAWPAYIKTIFVYGFFISLNHMLLLCIQLADAFTLVPGLTAFGFSLEEAKIWKGIFDRGYPLIQLGTVLGSSLALVLIPAITKQRLEQQGEAFQADIQSAWKFSFLISSGAAAGLIAIFPYANELLFLTNTGTGSLRVLAVAIFLTSLIITASSVLQGLGYVYATGIYVIAGLLLKWLCNFLLVPWFGVLGSAAATITSLSAVLLLNAYKMKRNAPDILLLQLPWKTWGTAIFAMFAFLFISEQIAEKVLFLSGRAELLGYIIVVSSVGALVYIGILIKLNGFLEKELLAFPGGKALIRLQKGGMKR